MRKKKPRLSSSGANTTSFELADGGYRPECRRPRSTSWRGPFLRSTAADQIASSFGLMKYGAQTDCRTADRRATVGMAAVLEALPGPQRQTGVAHFSYFSSPGIGAERSQNSHAPLARAATNWIRRTIANLGVQRDEGGEIGSASERSREIWPNATE